MHAARRSQLGTSEAWEQGKVREQKLCMGSSVHVGACRALDVEAVSRLVRGGIFARTLIILVWNLYLYVFSFIPCANSRCLYNIGTTGGKHTQDLATMECIIRFQRV